MSAGNYLTSKPAIKMKQKTHTYAKSTVESMIVESPTTPSIVFFKRNEKPFLRWANSNFLGIFCHLRQKKNSLENVTILALKGYKTIL